MSRNLQSGSVRLLQWQSSVKSLLRLSFHYRCCFSWLISQTWSSKSFKCITNESRAVKSQAANKENSKKKKEKFQTQKQRKGSVITQHSTLFSILQIISSPVLPPGVRANSITQALRKLINFRHKLCKWCHKLTHFHLWPLQNSNKSSHAVKTHIHTHTCLSLIALVLEANHVCVLCSVCWEIFSSFSLSIARPCPLVETHHSPVWDNWKLLT